MLTLHQEQFIRETENDPQFEQWCLNPRTMVSGVGDRPWRPRPKLFTYYTKDGVLHAVRVGQQEVLRRITFPPVQEET